MPVTFPCTAALPRRASGSPWDENVIPGGPGPIRPRRAHGDLRARTINPPGAAPRIDSRLPRVQHLLRRQTLQCRASARPLGRLPRLRRRPQDSCTDRGVALGRIGKLAADAKEGVPRGVHEDGARSEASDRSPKAAAHTRTNVAWPRVYSVVVTVPRSAPHRGGSALPRARGSEHGCRPSWCGDRGVPAASGWCERRSRPRVGGSRTNGEGCGSSPAWRYQPIKPPPLRLSG